MYRVPVYTDSKTEQHKTSDQLEVLKKTRTRALKRKATDASDEPKGKKKGKKAAKPAASSAAAPPPSDDESSSSSSFSDEASGSSEDEVAAASASRGNNKRPKVDKEQKKAEKKVAAIKKKASAAREKLSDAIKSAREVLSHECIDDLDDALTKPLRDAVRELRLTEQLCAKCARTGVDTFSEEVASFDAKGFRKLQSTLLSKLKKAAKASAKA